MTEGDKDRPIAWALRVAVPLVLFLGFVYVFIGEQIDGGLEAMALVGAGASIVFSFVFAMRGYLRS